VQDSVDEGDSLVEYTLRLMRQALARVIIYYAHHAEIEELTPKGAYEFKP